MLAREVCFLLLAATNVAQRWWHAVVTNGAAWPHAAPGRSPLGSVVVTQAAYKLKQALLQVALRVRGTRHVAASVLSARGAAGSICSRLDI